MKQIEINGRKFLYAVGSTGVGETWCRVTRFYEYKMGTVRHHIFWTREEMTNVFAFGVSMDIESLEHSKEYVNKWVMQEFRIFTDKEEAVRLRSEQISKGEII